MFFTPYNTLSHTPSNHALRAANEAKAFAFWQTMTTTQDRFASLLRWGRSDTAHSLDGRWLPAE